VKKFIGSSGGGLAAHDPREYYEHTAPTRCWWRDPR